MKTLMSLAALLVLANPSPGQESDGIFIVHADGEVAPRAVLAYRYSHESDYRYITSDWSGKVTLPDRKDGVLLLLSLWQPSFETEDDVELREYRRFWFGHVRVEEGDRIPRTMVIRSTTRVHGRVEHETALDGEVVFVHHELDCGITPAAPFRADLEDGEFDDAHLLPGTWACWVVTQDGYSNPKVFKVEEHGSKMSIVLKPERWYSREFVVHGDPVYQAPVSVEVEVEVAEGEDFDPLELGLGEPIAKWETVHDSNPFEELTVYHFEVIEGHWVGLGAGGVSTMFLAEKGRTHRVRLDLNRDDEVLVRGLVNCTKDEALSFLSDDGTRRWADVFENGTYEVRLPPGTYAAGAWRIGNVPVTVPEVREADIDLVVDTGPTWPPLAPSGTDGRVEVYMTTEDGMPTDFTGVWFFSDDMWRQIGDPSAVGGYWVEPCVPAGRWSVEVTDCESDRVGQAWVDVREGETSKVNIRLAKAGSLTVSVGAGGYGRLPCRITVSRQGGRTYFLNDREFWLAYLGEPVTGLVPGTYDIIAEHPFRGRIEKRVELAPGEEKRVRLEY